MSLESPLHHLEESENVETCVRPDSAIETAQKAVAMPQYPFVNAAYRLVVLKVCYIVFSNSWALYSLEFSSSTILSFQYGVRDGF